MTRVRDAVGGLSARAILAIGWLGFMVYAYPGYLSYDSVVQLGQARSGVYSDAHPPIMSGLWAVIDTVIAGPLGMLVVQSTCFLGGAYLLLRRCMSDRGAALGAAGLLWFPPVAAVLAVIWKDSQMAAYLMLGAALLGSPRRGQRVVGLALLSLATAMRYNALAITLPLVVLVFVWSPTHRWWQRYGLALAAWAALTVTAGRVNALLTDTPPRHMWHEGLALLDLTGTLRYAPDLPDDQLRAALAGTPLRVTTEIQRQARASHRAEDLPEHTVQTFGTGSYVPALWISTYHLFDQPTTAAQRDAVARAWRAVVLAHPRAYLVYRWHVLRERIHLGDGDIPSGAYVWFTDVLDLSGSARTLGHTARSSGLQGVLQRGMWWLGSSWLFRPWIYLVLALGVAAASLRRRDALALVLSGLANEAALFVLAPTIDYRYSFWLVVTSVLGLIMVIAHRVRRARGATSSQ